MADKLPWALVGLRSRPRRPDPCINCRVCEFNLHCSHSLSSRTVATGHAKSTGPKCSCYHAELVTAMLALCWSDDMD